jgi:hypothetical protein
MSGILQDIRHAFRAMRGSPGLTFVIVASPVQVTSDRQRARGRRAGTARYSPAPLTIRMMATVTTSARAASDNLIQQIA